MSNSFGERLRTAVDESGRLCVGIDPHAYLLKDWGLADTAEGVRELSLRVIDAIGDAAAVIKPQVAFFERHGAAGYAVLEEVLATAREAGLLVIADAKRGDVGTSVEAYGQAWLTPGSPLEADALTVSAFQGVASLASVLDLAAREGKGLFVLAATSNPESRVIQQSLTAEGRSVAATITDDVARWNTVSTPDAAWGSVGLVLGATVSLRDYGIDPSELAGTPVLAPGFGHQGAKIAELQTIFGAVAPSVLVNASRSILSAGPDGVARAIRGHAEEIAAAL
ncbi:orotidine-5'-phosphate decarboxylase [Salinibacterium sp. GXW1014]|uniref:orotidine-5'-phosphate decarboxylase n=1 Tax=Salinibacterium sp. GXW1014 TaxID=3377838 RepID=UPI00383B7CEB